MLIVKNFQCKILARETFGGCGNPVLSQSHLERRDVILNFQQLHQLMTGLLNTPLIWHFKITRFGKNTRDTFAFKLFKL